MGGLTLSLTIEAILKLPHFKNAQVLSSKRNLGRMVNSVSVLEYSNPNKILDDFLSQNATAGSEVILTAFSSISHDVDKQCRIVKEMSLYGEIAIFVYYVGIIVPKIDQRVIDVAEKLGIVLVCMEKNNLCLRYSEAISDIMEQVIANRKFKNFEGEMLTQISLLPVNQRTIQSVLSLLRDTIKATLVIRSFADSRPLNIAISPESFEKTIINNINNNSIPKTWWVKDFQLYETQGPSMVLSIIKIDSVPLENEICLAVVNVIQLFLNIWNPGHGQMIVTEMVRAILKDEPVKMKRLGELFNINVTSINEMWIISQNKNNNKEKEKRFVEKCLKESYRQVISDDFEGKIIAFTNGKCLSSREEVSRQIKKEYPNEKVCCISSLKDTNMVRKIYLLYCRYIENAIKIFPKAEIYNRALIDFAKEISDNINTPHKNLFPGKLYPIINKPVLLETLVVYILDCNQDIKKAAEVLNIHPNTLKYRIGQATDKLCISSSNRFEMLSIATELATARLLENNN